MRSNCGENLWAQPLNAKWPVIDLMTLYYKGVLAYFFISKSKAWYWLNRYCATRGISTLGGSDSHLCFVIGLGQLTHQSRHKGVSSLLSVWLRSHMQVLQLKHTYMQNKYWEIWAWIVDIIIKTHTHTHTYVYHVYNHYYCIWMYSKRKCGLRNCGICVSSFFKSENLMNWFMTYNWFFKGKWLRKWH